MSKRWKDGKCFIICNCKGLQIRILSFTVKNEFHSVTQHPNETGKNDRWAWGAGQERKCIQIMDTPYCKTGFTTAMIKSTTSK